MGQILLLAAGFLVLVAISAASVVLVTQSRKDNARVVHTVEVENQLSTLLLQIRRAEEDRQFASRTATADRTQQLASVVTVAGSGLVIALAGIAIFLVRRSLRARDEAETKLRDNNLNLETTVDERTADLREANDEIQRFAYIVSHDLRSPLVNIMGFTSELEELRTDIFRRIAALGRVTADSPLVSAVAGEMEPVLQDE